jgi:hypothetical protein
MIPVVLVVATLLAGLGLTARLLLNARRRIRPPMTLHLFDDSGSHYWDGSHWQPVVGRYDRPERRPKVRP